MNSYAEDTEDISKIFKAIIQKAIKHEDAEPFLYPVDGKLFPKYYQFIKHPMDLSTLKEQIPSYETKEDFFADVKLIHTNCATFNAPGSHIIAASENLVSFVKELISVLKNFACF